jgi:hypothetical protein
MFNILAFGAGGIQPIVVAYLSVLLLYGALLAEAWRVWRWARPTWIWEDRRTFLVGDGRYGATIISTNGCGWYSNRSCDVEYDDGSGTQSSVPTRLIRRKGRTDALKVGDEVEVRKGKWEYFDHGVPPSELLLFTGAAHTAQIHKNMRHVIDAQKIRHVIDAAFSNNAFWAYILAKTRAYI